jgi:hypothetical protein
MQYYMLQVYLRHKEIMVAVFRVGYVYIEYPQKKKKNNDIITILHRKLKWREKMLK